MGLSDFTDMADLGITVAGQPLIHRLYRFRLAYRACQTKVGTGFVARHAEKQKVRVCLAILSSPDRL